MSAGRPLKLSPAKRQEFATGWRNPLLTTKDLCRAFEFSVASAYALARRMHLPHRAAIRAQAGLPKYGPRPTGWQQGHATMRAQFELNAAHQLAKCEAYLARERDPKAPRWVRCPSCGGKVDTQVGHPRCGQAA